MAAAPRSPLLTSREAQELLAARQTGASSLPCTLDLQRSITTVDVGPADWSWHGRRFPYLERPKERTIYYFTDGGFQPVARYDASLIKLVPTEWGAPTFEIDGIKMLPTSRISPYADAERKVALIEPRGKLILDTCGGLGYMAAWCVQGLAQHVHSCEKNPAVIWLRSLNPWSPAVSDALSFQEIDVTHAVATLKNASMDAILHDPPRFGIAGELYSQRFYGELSRVLKRGGRLFHYTGSPNKRSRNRDLAGEVMRRLASAGFTANRRGDGILATKG